jgi:hypothetical protein
VKSVSPRVLALVASVAVLRVPLAVADSCNGDTAAQKSASISKTSESSVVITSQTWLLHYEDHPGCHGNGGDLSALAQLFNQFGFTGCEEGNVGSQTSAFTDRECADLPQGTYQNTGSFKFAEHSTGPANSATVTLAGPPPPPPPPEGPCACTECPCSPLIVDLAGNGFQFSGAEDGALFGLSGPLRMYWVGWPLHDDDRWVALDRNGNGWIDDASELFGTATRLAGGKYARHGYEALAELDDNSDGQIDAQDSVFGSLLLWGDSNRNGLSEPLELGTLARLGVTSLSLEFRDSSRVDEWGNRFALRSLARAEAPPRTLRVVDVFPVCRPAP